jgi:LCP family protein required for cell wall assembly
VAANIVVAVCLLGSGLVYGYVRYRNGQITRIPVGGLAAGAAGQPTTILLVGSNTRAGLSPAEAKNFGTAADVGGARSDVTMLVHLDPKAGTVSLLSIPRDLFMPIPGQDKQQRVDAALNSGPDQLVQTIEDDLGIPINHYVELNFDTFQSVVNDLGGVDMNFPAPVRDAESGLHTLQTGCLHLNGAVALAVVRARHLEYETNGVWVEDPNGDLARIRRDHEFLRVLATAVQHRGLDNPLTVNKILGSIAPKLKVDSGLSLSTMVSLARRFRRVGPDTVPTVTLPVIPALAYQYRGVDYGDVVLPTQPLDQQTIDQFLGLAAPPFADQSPAGTTVTVVNRSGTAGKGTAVANELRALGFTAPAATTGAFIASPGESVIVYGPGQLPAAQHLQSVLGGSVVLGRAGPAPAAGLVLQVGTSLTVPGTTPPPATTTPVATATTGSTPPTTARPASGVSSVGGGAIAVNDTPQSFDPTACARGVKGQ